MEAIVFTEIVGTVRLDHGLDKRGSILSRGREGIFSLRHREQTGSEAHPASYPMGIRDKAAGALR